MTHWILDEQGQLDFVAQTAYPTEIKTIELTDYEPEAQKFLPVGDNIRTAIPEQGEYLLEALPTLSEEFNQWVAD